MVDRRRGNRNQQPSPHGHGSAAPRTTEVCAKHRTPEVPFRFPAPSAGLKLDAARARSATITCAAAIPGPDRCPWPPAAAASGLPTCEPGKDPQQPEFNSASHRLARAQPARMLPRQGAAAPAARTGAGRLPARGGVASRGRRIDAPKRFGHHRSASRNSHSRIAPDSSRHPLLAFSLRHLLQSVVVKASFPRPSRPLRSESVGQQMPKCGSAAPRPSCPRRRGPGAARVTRVPAIDAHGDGLRDAFNPWLP